MSCAPGGFVLYSGPNASRSGGSTMNTTPKLTRRSAVRAMGAAGAAAATGGLLGPRQLSAAGRKADIFALVGDRFHNYDYIRTALHRTLVKEAGVTAVFTPDYSLLTLETLKAHRLLI